MVKISLKMAGTNRKIARSRSRSENDAGDDNTNVRNSKPVQRPRKFKVRNSNFIRIGDFNLKFLLGFGTISFSIALLFIYHIVNRAEDVRSPLPRVITPFPAPKIMDLPMFQGEHEESLYWGTYRPQYYLGIRARIPESLLAGLMWLGVKDGGYHMRHVCENNDGLSKYGWISHNGRDYGHQVINDHSMILKTSFLKSKVAGSGFGGDWAVRLDVQTEKSTPHDEMLESAHLFFYVAEEGGNALSLSKSVTDNSESSVLAFGSRADVGGWEMHLKSKDNFEVHYSGFKTPHIHNLSDLVIGTLALQARKVGRVELPDISDDSSNILVFQITARTPFQADIAFISGTGLSNARVEERVSILTGTSLTSQFNEKQKKFDDKFKRRFDPSDKLDSELITVGKAAIGNLLGGISYSFGQSKISLPQTPNTKPGDNFLSYWPAELYTAVPSRPFFPRGFLWDEGFHQLLIWRWDVHISLDIIGHWLDLMNVDGWIPREQILGAEALSKVPEEFVLQHPSNGNPPTLFLALRDLVCGMMKKKFDATESSEISAFLERSFVRLEAWFQWFNTTQSGKETGSYYWHGRDSRTIRELNPKSLSSGLDDYPRASHPNDLERHVDLRCWMFLAADCMHSISEKHLKKTKAGKKFGLTAKLLSDFELLNQMHYDNDRGAYFDYGNHTEKVRLTRQVVPPGKNQHTELVREVLEEPIGRFVPHVGYVSLFPFITKIIPPKSPILDKQLDLIYNRSTLWTDFGLRSLSKTSSIYMKRNTEHDAPYWRGPVWMNINYLILSSLHHYSKEDGPYRERAKTIYNELRGNLIRNVVKNYNQTGYMWEQYDQKTGEGKGARVFTGWTSLVLLIMAETYSEC